MEQKIIKYFIILIIQISFIFNEELNGVYNIKSMDSKNLKASFNRVFFANSRIRKYDNFRIKKYNSNSYLIESVFSGKFLGINFNDELILSNIGENNFWNIIKINDNEYLIQNNNTKKYLAKKEYIGIARCSKIIEEIPKDSSNISNTLKYSFFKLYEEVQLKPEHIEFIEKEPVDVLIKYIDLSDKTLNREGIQQIPKDEDHEELRYCVRSILDNIPWIRKIFILMPNDKVSYFKPIEEIKDKIVYVKDKDLMGYDTANIYAFHFVLFNMSKFGLSENFILMDDDYFIGKPINKTKFFYYDEELKKVLPSIVSDQFSELSIKTNIKRSKFYKPEKIDPHTSLGWQFHSYLTYKLLIDNFEPPLVNAGFTHNAVSLNLNDIKEIYEFIKNKFEYFNITLYSKTRPIYCLQSHTLFNSYLLNIKKRKVNTISRRFFDLRDIIIKRRRALEQLNIELFVINTSGDYNYNPMFFYYEKQILEKKYNKPTPYEIVSVNSTIYNFKEEEKMNFNIDLKNNFDIKYLLKNKIKEKNNKMHNYFLKKEKISFNNNNKINEEFKNNIKNETKQYSIEYNVTFINKEDKIYTKNEEKNFNIKYNEKKYKQFYLIFKLFILLLFIIILAIIIYFLFLKLFAIIRKEKYIEKHYLSKKKQKTFYNEEEKYSLNIKI